MSFNFQNQMHPKTDEELLNIYYDFDQYQDEYLEIVSEEMEKRGIDFTNLKLRKQHKEAFMLELTEKGKPGDPVYITLGFISALFGGVLGIITGYMYSQSKNKEWGDGTYYYYDLKTRNLGTGMMLLGFFVLIISFLYKVT
jgi:hypothetical protein